MNIYRNLLLAAAANLARDRLRSAVVVVCLVAICGPYVTGIAISEGVRADAEIAVQEGADLYLSFDHFGRNAPVPLRYLEALRSSRSITAVVPRVVGRAIAFVDAPKGRRRTANWWSSSVWSPVECDGRDGGRGTRRWPNRAPAKS